MNGPFRWISDSLSYTAFLLLSAGPIGIERLGVPAPAGLIFGMLVRAFLRLLQLFGLRT